ncbi:hypothetical protein KBE46_03400 [Candidatus Saccharibacteria bacterium]|jgi:hypothetical protein|nr:hypothetical protein [Candidatus Saccharibacteria bacterium]
MKLPQFKFFKKEKTAEEKKTVNQFSIFIAGSLTIAMILSGFSLWLYNESGAAQLDLSRPSYQEAREEAKKEEDKENDNGSNEFSADGTIDEKTISEFEKLYNERLKKIQADAFKEDPLSDKSLNILDDEAEPQN